MTLRNAFSSDRSGALMCSQSGKHHVRTAYRFVRVGHKHWLAILNSRPPILRLAAAMGNGDDIDEVAHVRVHDGERKLPEYEVPQVFINHAPISGLSRTSLTTRSTSSPKRRPRPVPIAAIH
jgi:hypothetical protein